LHKLHLIGIHTKHNNTQDFCFLVANRTSQNITINFCNRLFKHC